MNGFEALIRALIFLALLYFVVIRWALAPIINPDLEITMTVEGYFFSRAPTGLARNMLLTSRLLPSLGLSLFVLIPALGYLFEFEKARPLANTVLLLAVLGGVALFALSAFVYLYY